MSIWGKLLAGTFGFALGGPIGALLGAVSYTHLTLPTIAEV